LLADKAELVECDEGVVRSASVSIPVPTVVRLRYMVRVPRRAVAAVSRRAVFARDEYRCQYCGARADSIDHVLPRSRGGSHVWENLAAACRELHELDPLAVVGAVPEVWWLQPDDAAIVLGSRQTPDLVDSEACARLGLTIVRRRSGGGAVLVVPDQLVWIDIIAPAGVAPDDVRGSMVWAGEMWGRALAPDIGESGALSVHAGPMMATAWSDLVCFAGLGPGEVLLDGRKLVGLSQRRTRNGIRIQGTLYTSPPGIDITALLRAPKPAARPPEIATLAVDPATVAARLAAALGAWHRRRPD
jgi:5-methylcytosine-specific restriction endonuclease McrA